LLDLPRTAALALIQTAISITAFAISERANRKVVSFDDVADDPTKERVDVRDWPVVAITATIVLGLLVVPMWDIFSRAFSDLSNFTMLTSKGTRDVLNISVTDALLNSFRNLLISTTIALVIGTLIAWLLVHTKLGRYKSIIDVILLLPLGISTVVLGFGYLITFTPSSIPLREYWVVVPLIQSVLAIPLVTRIVYPSIASLGRVQIESASTEGATAWQIWRYVEAPQMRHALTTATAFAGLVSIGEFGAASLLAFGDQATLPTVLYSLISRPGGVNYGMAMAVSVILIIFTFIVVWVASSGTPRRRQRRRSARA
jgi:thiamine transport system permease protein